VVLVAAGSDDRLRRVQQSDLIKSPVVLDFLDLPDSEALHEGDVERAILGKLSQFILELGKGFAFVARQKRLTFADEEFFVDLVFYNIVVKCFLLIDLLCAAPHNATGHRRSQARQADPSGPRPDADVRELFRPPGEAA